MGRLSLRWSMLLVSLLAALVVAATAAARDVKIDSRVIPPNAHAFGKSYGEWSAAWWQYAYSIPVPDNPLFDETGAKCGVGQSGPVFFLVGVINVSGEAERSCIVPADTALFFPVLNTEFDNVFPPSNQTVAQLRLAATQQMDTATNMTAELDGRAITGLESAATSPFRTGSSTPVFSVTFPDNNIPQFFGFDVPAGTYSPFVGDGFYLMLKPLEPGLHTLHFGGSVPGFTLDIVYHLTVASG
jgi:hypothetical protein